MADDREGARDRFFARLTEKFAPRLREAGFRGHGIHLRRVGPEVIHLIHLQGDRSGRGCAVNLGIQPTLLADVPAESTALEAEFRKRLAPPGRIDYWWRYEGWLFSPRQRADFLIRCYFDHGEPWFRRYDSLDAILEALTIDRLEAEEQLSDLGNIHRQQAAWVAARLYEKLGESSEQKRLAEYGLCQQTTATALIEDLRKLATP